MLVAKSGVVVMFVPFYMHWPSAVRHRASHFKCILWLVYNHIYGLITGLLTCGQSLLSDVYSTTLGATAVSQCTIMLQCALSMLCDFLIDIRVSSSSSCSWEIFPNFSMTF